ncbi:hypothetical protein [Thioalkalivibrio sp. HK1]|uniref:hypothetical protein n=1 Tax=Thioalkalivibrio sp. HK1 TaxID=1469245 RepID=UPI0004729475|nr:hypothetical protein [Thioalkalivibrio sp. HK1]
MDNELLREKIEKMEAARPFVQWRSRLMSAVISFLREERLRPVAGAPGLEDQPLRWVLSGVYRHLNAAKAGRPRQNLGPHGEMPGAQMTEAI